MSIETLYSEQDGLGLAELVKKREVKPLELVEEAIRRIEALNPQLNAVVHTMYDQALQNADSDLPDGQFMGVPFLLKDLLAEYAGQPISSGSRFFMDYTPDEDCELVKRFKRAGVVVVGKTNTPEFGITPYTESELFGAAHNPWDTSRTTGGSSGGSAAAVASGMVPLASGGDGGGSIRVPSSCCGLFGLKPNRGRNPGGMVAGAYWFDSVVDHVLTRSVRDSAAMLDATHGYHPGMPHATPSPERPFLEEVKRDPGKLRIAFTTKPFLGKSMHPDCIAGLEATVKLLQDLGHTLVEDAPSVDRVPVSLAFMTTVISGVVTEIEAGEKLMAKKATPKDFEAVTWAVALVAKRLPARRLIESLRLLQKTSEDIAIFMQDYDFLLTPTLSTPPAITGSLQVQGFQKTLIEILAGLNAGWLLEKAKLLEQAAEDIYEFIPSTPLNNFSGSPAMSVPLYWNAAGLPIGMHFMAGYAEEAKLFRLAGQLERAKPWFDKRPPVAA